MQVRAGHHAEGSAAGVGHRRPEFPEPSGWCLRGSRASADVPSGLFEDLALACAVTDVTTVTAKRGTQNLSPQVRELHVPSVPSVPAECGS